MQSLISRWRKWTNELNWKIAVDNEDRKKEELLDLEEQLAELKQEEQSQKQRAAVLHSVENLFPYVPVKVEVQKYPASSSQAGQAYLWITVDEEAAQRMNKSTQRLKGYPTGVAVDMEGNVFVTDGSTGSERQIAADCIMNLTTKNEPPARPSPPKLFESTRSMIKVRWKKAFDSTVDKYEVQYRPSDRPNDPWNTLATTPSTKRTAILDRLQCHSAYLFRVRVKNPIGWSEYSEESEIMWTQPGIPDWPVPPVFGVASDTFISVYWFPVRGNGSLPVIYKLEVKKVVDSFINRSKYIEIYSGPDCDFVASGLDAESMYTFRLTASNAVGSTKGIETRPVRTLSPSTSAQVIKLRNGAETIAESHWIQCWEPSTDEVFYFNRITSERVLIEPEELKKARLEKGLKTIQETPEMIFRQKRFRFHRHARQNVPKQALKSTLKLQVHRKTILEDTMAAFERLDQEELFGKPKITFIGEEGIDSGGLTKDWYLQTSSELAASTRQLFKACDDNQIEIHPQSQTLQDFRRQFEFAGQLVAKAIFDRQTVSMPFAKCIYQNLLQQDTDMRTLAEMDGQFHRSLMWMLENNIDDVIDETFSVETVNINEQTTIIDLKEYGRDIPVTNANKKEYVDLIVQWRTYYAIKPQIESFIHGFKSILSIESIQVFTPTELHLLANGKRDVDVEEIRAGAVFQGGYSQHTQVVLWLWQALRSFPIEQRHLFVKFVTGSDRVPLDGFEPPFNVTKSDLDPQALPKAHTCFNQLVLPEYQAYETLLEKIDFAIRNAEGFELS